jgi:hypothetical protein
MQIGDLINEEFKRITQAYTTRARIKELFSDNFNTAYHIRYKESKLTEYNLPIVEGLLNESLRCVREAKDNEAAIIKLLNEVKSNK